MRGRDRERERERDRRRERDTFFGKEKRRKRGVVGLTDVERKGCTRKDVDAALS